jgi:alpha-beta hydrolase superfamily lysophospholipase
MKRTVIIPTGREKDILVDITSPNDPESKGVVIFCHGYKGYKDWGAWNLVADEFASLGFIFVKFNFSHNGGTLENPIDFPDLEAFGYNTYSKEVEDLNSVIEWSHKEFGQPISIIGHSRGGGIVTLVGGSNSNISKVISWAAVADFKERFPVGKKLQEWKDKGVNYVVNGRTKQEMPHYFSFYENFIKNEENLTISKAAKNMRIPHLIIHGDNDEAVLIEDAHRLCAFNPEAELEIISDANHTFGSKHPWNESFLPDPLGEVVDKTINFINSSNKL